MGIVTAFPGSRFWNVPAFRDRNPFAWSPKLADGPGANPETDCQYRCGQVIAAKEINQGNRTDAGGFVEDGNKYLVQFGKITVPARLVFGFLPKYSSRDRTSKI
jgi:hypothetical protein